jgi:uncharacterized protein YndB with AHSA1/START domain
MSDRFVYVTYIQTTPEKLWEALTNPDFTKRYWAGTRLTSDWKAGSEWKLMIPDGRVGDGGEVVEIDPPHKLVLTWRNEFLPEMKADGFARCTFELEPQHGVVKLTIVHESEREKSKLIEAVSRGWPMILASLKTMLETGAAFPGSDKWPKGM